MKPNFLRIITVTFALLFAGGIFQAGAANTSAEALNMEASSSHTADMSAHLMQDEPGRFGEDSAQCVRNWSLYAEYYRQRNFEMAYEPWKWMFLNCPAATQNIYIHGANLLRNRYAQETDPQAREGIVDTLMMLYNQRIEYFGREGFVLGRKAADLYQFRPDSVQRHYELSEKSIEKEGLGSQADVLLINFQAATNLYEAGMIEGPKIVEKFSRASDIIDYNLENNPQDSIYFNPAKENIEALFEPFASCDNLVALFEDRFQENPNDPDLLERITSMLDDSGCRDTELFYQASKNYHELNPKAESAILMGRLENDRGNHGQAITYLQQAIELYKEKEEDVTSEKFRTYLLMANISYRDRNRMPEARNFARKAEEVNPNDGRPNILIGEMYAASAEDCGDDDFTKKVAYWVAVDEFIKARDAAEDPTVEERARELIRTYRQYFPDNELIFFHGYSEGDSYRVQCWINQTTRVRPR